MWGASYKISFYKTIQDKELQTGLYYAYYRSGLALQKCPCHVIHLSSSTSTNCLGILTSIIQQTNDSYIYTRWGRICKIQMIPLRDPSI